jgi:hypothetical protein
MSSARTRRNVSGILAAVFVAGALAACGGKARAGKPDEGRVAAIYEAVILAAVGPHSANEKPPVVFVVPQTGTKPIPLPVQASVVDDLSGDVTVRFVDDEIEAIDGALPGRPVKEGLLLRLGPVPVSGDPVEVMADRYRTTSDEQRLTLTARSNGQHWDARIIEAVPLAPES